MFLFFKDPTTTEIYTFRPTLTLHDSLPICVAHPLRLFLGCSSAHLSPIARTYLDAGDGIASTTSYGWFVYASEEPDDAVPADLAFIMAHAQTLGAEYINFDCDALEIDDLPTFDWSG